MKKKSLFWSMLAIMMVTMLSVGFAACGDDDDDDDGGAASVVGTWSGRDGGDQITLTFRKDGTGTYIEVYEDSYYDERSRDAGTFTYTMEGSSKGIIVVQHYDSYYGQETDILYFVIEGKTMTLYEDGYYDDLEFVLTKQ